MVESIQKQINVINNQLHRNLRRSLTPEELNETTMDINKRILRQITVEDTRAADEVFSKLMGDEVEPRRQFIEENAVFVQNLDA